jgi:hypothetical protein
VDGEIRESAAIYWPPGLETNAVETTEPWSAISVYWIPIEQPGAHYVGTVLNVYAKAKSQIVLVGTFTIAGAFNSNPDLRASYVGSVVTAGAEKFLTTVIGLTQSNAPRAYVGVCGYGKEPG